LTPSEERDAYDPLQTPVAHDRRDLYHRSHFQFGTLPQRQTPVTSGVSHSAVRSYLFSILLAIMVRVPLAMNMGPRIETVSPTFKAPTPATFSKSVCAEVVLRQYRVRARMRQEYR